MHGTFVRSVYGTYGRYAPSVAAKSNNKFVTAGLPHESGDGSYAVPGLKSRDSRSSCFCKLLSQINNWRLPVLFWEKPEKKHPRLTANHINSKLNSFPQHCSPATFKAPARPHTPKATNMYTRMPKFRTLEHQTKKTETLTETR